jgi:hypothetical protein
MRHLPSTIIFARCERQRLWATYACQLTAELWPSAALQNRRNATRLCEHVVSDECIQRTTPEICITLLLEEVLRGPAATTASGGSSSNRTAAIAVPVAVGGALVHFWHC